MDWDDGFIGGVILVALLVAAFALGVLYKVGEISRSCEDYGAFAVNHTVYDCKRRVTP